MTVIHIGPHERADNPQSSTGWFASAMEILSESFNESLKAHQESSKKKAEVKVASLVPQPSDIFVKGPVRIKLADTVDAPDQSQIEVALEQLAERQIAARAPALMPYWLGFQLLKKTSDNTRACGIFAFKADQELIYIPVFCINGELQGYELMYLVSQDRFVPSDEKQVNYLLSRRPSEPGKIELRDKSKIRQRASLRGDQMLGGLKLSSACRPIGLPKPIVEDALRRVFKEAAAPICVASSLRYNQAMADLDPSDLFNLSAKATKLAAIWSDIYPVYQRLLDYTMGENNIRSLKKEWEKRASIAKKLGLAPVALPTLQQYMDARTKKAAAPDAGSVSVKTASEIPDHQFGFMPTEVIDSLHRKGYYVSDTRDQTKLAMLMKATKTRNIQNPMLPGLYNVFMSDRTFKKCAVVQGWSCGSWSQSRTWVVFDLQAKTYTEAPSQDIIVDTAQPDGDWFKEVTSSGYREDFTKKEDDDDRSKKKRRFLVIPKGSVCREDWFETDSGQFQSWGTAAVKTEGVSGFKDIPDSNIMITPTDTEITAYIEDRGILGSLLQWEELLYEKTIPLRVQKRDRSSGRYAIDGLPEMEKSSALEMLMKEYHLSEGNAETVLTEADTKYPVQAEYRREKVAFSGRPSMDSIAVNFPAKDRSTDWLTGLDIEHDLFTSERVDSLANDDSSRRNRDFNPGAVDVDLHVEGSKPPMPNAYDLQMATQASDSGQREFVSSQMLMSLLREIDDDGIISKYVSVFEKACDALGRLYMQVLWRVDAFEERFGESELKEFKEMLLELFQRLGDFVCYLRQRDIRPESRLSLEHATDIGEDFGSL